MTTDFSYHITGPGRLHLTCRGRIDVLSVAHLRKRLARIVDGRTDHLTVDLSEIDQLDAAGVAALAGAASALRRRGATMVLRAPADDEIGRILDYSGLAPLLAA